jgi:hypothetical protein
VCVAKKEIAADTAELIPIGSGKPTSSVVMTAYTLAMKQLVLIVGA